MIKELEAQIGKANDYITKYESVGNKPQEEQKAQEIYLQASSGTNTKAYSFSSRQKERERSPQQLQQLSQR